MICYIGWRPMARILALAIPSFDCPAGMGAPRWALIFSKHYLLQYTVNTNTDTWRVSPRQHMYRISRRHAWFKWGINRSEPSRFDNFLAKERSWTPLSGKKFARTKAPDEATVPKFSNENQMHNRPTKRTISDKFEGAIPLGASVRNQLLKPRDEMIRPSVLGKIHPDEEKHPDLPGYIAPMPTETHLSFHAEMCADLEALGDRYDSIIC